MCLLTGRIPRGQTHLFNAGTNLDIGTGRVQFELGFSSRWELKAIDTRSICPLAIRARTGESTRDCTNPHLTRGCLRTPKQDKVLDVIRKQAWPFYRTISGVRLCWELEEPEGPKDSNLVAVLTWHRNGSNCIQHAYL